MRVSFCGVIEGSVTRRPGETDDEAIARAEATLNALLEREAKRFGRVAQGGLTKEQLGAGPIVGLEPAD